MTWTPTIRPGSTEVRVESLPNCDLRPCPNPAAYDARLPRNATLGGAWAYVCEAHAEQFDISLGTGCGQRLLTS
jgi:hypothetical protein